MDDAGKRAAGQLGEYGTMARPGERPFSDIVSDIVGHAQEIVRSEVRLAKAEIKQEASKAARASTMLVAGAIFGVIALGFFLWTAVYALALVMPFWAAALIVAVVLAIVALALASMGWANIRQVKPQPEKAKQEVKEDVQWLKQQTK
jgi:uncharacterized membrane protein YqjE